MTARDEFYRRLGARIRERRTARKLSQQELAVDAGLTRTSIANVEAGRQRLPVDRLVDISNALRTNPASLLPSTNPQPSNIDEIDKHLKKLSRTEREWVKALVKRTTG